MTGQQVILALYLLVLPGIAVLIALYIRKRKIHAIEEPPPTESAMRNALRAWLTNARITRAMVTMHTAGAKELVITLNALEAMNESQLRSTCESLLRMKDVRRVIALEALKDARSGLTTAQHAQFLKDLERWANPVPQRRSA